MLEAADGVIDPSGTILQTLESRWGVRPGDALVARIPFGVPVPSLDGDETAPRGDDAPRFLFVGRLEPRKGIDTLLAAIPSVLDRVPGATVDLAGGTPAGQPVDVLAPLRPEHRARVRVHGWVDEATRSRLMRACDIFVAPSRYESFGIVYLEAMAYGKPCVACDVGGARTVVGHERGGLLVPVGDPAALADAMVRLATDGDERRRLGARARAEVERQHTIPGMARATVDFYERVLERAGRAAR